ncbi:uncharacterized protein BO96DRAFT_348852 [Aspergillus niger CBS 101883]|uniref:Uncharacterized protein n=2 Tax=Aspergillus niger TaxID=5061 RepID=A2Q8C6_ASPNC|nr:uncharacterized protein BO96DRAFT_348852 [Aspergillus niger CBS 101883]XP_059599596.1 hypothetical protein An01g03860 [Aspergillus niger]PYH51937.1 hypothetical protein BO96DRAFT_348852 [Aspergillus niger CBS 101883]CAK36923.1 hypothetical protein An01g03860 [Aspergillus niger]
MSGGGVQEVGVLEDDGGICARRMARCRVKEEDGKSRGDAVGLLSPMIDGSGLEEVCWRKAEHLRTQNRSPEKYECERWKRKAGRRTIEDDGWNGSERARDRGKTEAAVKLSPRCVCGIQGSAGSPDTAMEGKKREKAAMITKIRGGLDDALED